jgi:hypothetical protein
MVPYMPYIVSAESLVNLDIASNGWYAPQEGEELLTAILEYQCFIAPLPTFLGKHAKLNQHHKRQAEERDIQKGSHVVDR